MALATIVTNLKAAMQTVSGVSAANVKIPAPEVPMTGSQLPAIVGDIDTFIINPSNLTVFRYPIDLYYLHAERDADSEVAIPALYPIPKAMFDAIAGHAALMASSYGVEFPEPSGEMGPISWRGKSYTGCVLHAVFKEKSATTWA